MALGWREYPEGTKPAPGPNAETLEVRDLWRRCDAYWARKEKLEQTGEKPPATKSAFRD